MPDKVYLKKEIKKDKIFENHPNLVFGLIMIAGVWLLFPLIFTLWVLPTWVVLLLWGVCIAVLIWWIIKKNESANLTKSSAFIVRDGVLYYIRLGYVLGEKPADPIDVAVMRPLDATMVARADENMQKTAYIQEARENPKTFSKCLDAIQAQNTSFPKLPPYVIKFCELDNPKLEKETDKYIWISYSNALTDGKRVEQKFRNVYGNEFIA